MKSTPIPFVSLSCLTVAVLTAQAAPPAGLVSRWKAENNALDTQAVNNGTEQGSVAYGPGAAGQAFSLGGAGYVSVASPTFNSYTNSFTVAGWIKITAYTNAPSLINFRNSNNDSGFTLEQLFGTPGSMAFDVAQNGVFNFVTSSGWQLNTPYYIAATFDAATGTAVIYRDGNIVASRNDLPHAVMSSVSAPSFQIGHNIVNGAFWNGLIDEMQFYDHALTPAEVASLSATTAAPTLIARWTFDETSGSLAHDSAGTSNGTLSGGATFVGGGVSGNAVSFDQATSSFVNMGAGFPGFTTGDFSLVAWVKTNTTVADSVFLSKHEAGTQNGYFLDVNATGGGGGSDKALFYSSGPASSNPVSTTVINDSAWHQVVGVYHAGANAEIYVDGAPIEDARSSSAIVSNSAPFLIGGVNANGIPNARYTGLIDEVQVYRTALSSTQVQYLFQNPGEVLGVSSPQLVPKIFVTNDEIQTIGEYTTSGATVNAALVSGPNNNPAGMNIAIFGESLFVAYRNAGAIGKYNANTGATVNTSFVTGLNSPYALAFSGGDLFVTNLGTGTIGKYNASTGATVNAALVAGVPNPSGLVVSGGNIFVTSASAGPVGEYVPNSGTVGKYDANTGAAVNASLITGLDAPEGITTSGGDLYIASYLANTIGKYTTSGATVSASLVSNLQGPTGIAVGSVPVVSNLKIISITHPAANTVHLECLGAPGALNRIESSLDPSPNNFTTLATRTPVDATGAFSYDDTSAGSKKFYRLAYP